MTIVLTPGDVTLRGWRDIYRGAVPALDPACHAGDRAQRGSRVARSSPRASRSMASTPASASSPASASTPADLATLQRNIVLSHAAGVGAPMPVPIARLMMALKLASLAQGASGVRLETVRLLEALLAKGLTPVVPVPGLGRRVGRSRAAGPYVGDDDRRRRDASSTARRVPAAKALADAGLQPLRWAPRKALRC